MRPAQRLALRQLASPEIGLAATSILGRGLSEYLEPYCDRNPIGHLYLRHTEARIALTVLQHPTQGSDHTVFTVYLPL